jgi:hypothetical protein
MKSVALPFHFGVNLHIEIDYSWELSEILYTICWPTSSYKKSLKIIFNFFMSKKLSGVPLIKHYKFVLIGNRKNCSVIIVCKNP